MWRYRLAPIGTISAAELSQILKETAKTAQGHSCVEKNQSDYLKKFKESKFENSKVHENYLCFAAALFLYPKP